MYRPNLVMHAIFVLELLLLLGMCVPLAMMIAVVSDLLTGVPLALIWAFYMMIVFKLLFSTGVGRYWAKRFREARAKRGSS